MDLNAGQLKGLEIMKNALASPYKRILENAGLDPTKLKITKWDFGIDVTCGCETNMIKDGIIDPLLVTKSALMNAASVATTILSTDCVISNVREYEGDR